VGQEYRGTYEEKKREEFRAWLEEQIRRQVKAVLAPHSKKIRTTNCMERLIKEIRRRTKVVGAFPDEESCLLLVTARAKAQEQAWRQRRYLNMDLLKELVWRLLRRR